VTHALVLYDGVCGLCNRLVAFLLKRDRHDAFRFAPLQSELARTILVRHGLDASRLDTVYVVEGYERPGQERVAARSRAIMVALRRLGGVWAVLSLLRMVPAPLTDLAYRFVARVRYRLFGKHDRCLAPPPGWQHKFVA
jgi:predicted DCC family thiol-disulfide oxidoreductase YuxK